MKIKFNIIILIINIFLIIFLIFIKPIEFFRNEKLNNITVISNEKIFDSYIKDADFKLIKKNNNEYVLIGKRYSICSDFKDLYMLKYKNYYTLVLLEKDWYLHDKNKNSSLCINKISININENFKKEDKIIIYYGVFGIKELYLKDVIN